MVLGSICNPCQGLYRYNVVHLMVGRLGRLPAETQQALQLLACMGHNAKFALLEVLSGETKDEIHDQM
jgi:hypothetical protein